MKVKVALPTKNEAESIQEMIEQLRAIGLEDIFVVDEHSSDGTASVAQKNGVPVFQRDGLGKGWGVRKAIQVAAEEGCEVLVIIDCDTTYPVAEIPHLLQRLATCDMVVGRRNFRSISLSRRLVNYLHTWSVNLLYGARLGDINSGLRALRVAPFRGLLDAPGFDIEAQITVRALKRGLRLREVPISYRKRRGSSKIRPQDTFVILFRILKERFLL